MPDINQQILAELRSLRAEVNDLRSYQRRGFRRNVGDYPNKLYTASPAENEGAPWKYYNGH